MGSRKNDHQNPAIKVTSLFAGIFVIIGKPFFFILLYLLTSVIFLAQSPFKAFNFLYRNSRFFKEKIRRKKTFTIFRIRNVKFRKKTKPIIGWLMHLNWNLQVFILAFEKFRRKIRSADKAKTSKLRLGKLFTFSLTFVFLISFIGGIVFWQVVLKDLPSPEDLDKRNVQVATKIYDRNHELLYTIYKDQKRTPVPLEVIPPQVRSATIIAEDQEFYSHSGFSLRGIIRAIYKDIKEGRLTGGSTITQQLVKNALLSPERTFIRKIKEITLAIEVERKFSKDKILEMYLNEVPYGGSAYGISEAASTFFGKKVEDITLAEAALLAGLPQSPTRYSPFGSSPENAVLRQKDILRRMQEKGYITEEQRTQAENEKIVFARNTVPIKAPHFVFYVRDLLEEKYGKEIVEQGGLEVVTTLDYQIQKLAEQVVAQEVNKLKNLHVGNAAVVILNPRNGEILAMVGSKDFFDNEHDGNVNVATRPRQPGSSIKVVNYAYALSNGLTPATIIPDNPTTFKVDGQPPYTPKNYEGGFRGNITLRSALAESRNIPAVKVLASYGVNNMIDLGRKMGISTWTDPKNYGLSLTLGGGEVKLIDLARVFATLANYGRSPEPIAFLKVTDYRHKILESSRCGAGKLVEIPEVVDASVAGASVKLDTDICSGKQVLDPRVAFMLTDILKDNNARSPSFGTNSLLVISNHPEVAVKTGTSNDLRDNLAVGYTQDYVVAVWIGNNDNSEMSRIASGVTGATPIFNKIMTSLLNKQPSAVWPVPDRLVQLPICPYTGSLACEGCPIKMEWFMEENKPEKACNKEMLPGGGDSPTTSPNPKKRGGQYFENLLKNQMNKIKNKLND